MERELHTAIFEVERQWKALVRQELKALFSAIWLPSHDIAHHERVWCLAKQLLLMFGKPSCNYPGEFVEALFIGCYFHDTGLIRTLDFSHGKESAKILQDFIAKHPLCSNKYYNSLLEAVIEHDNKSYSGKGVSEGQLSIYVLLTIADDLDAFGALGLYRYFEIYIGRNINLEYIVARVEENLASRLKFVGNLLYRNKELNLLHQQRCGLAREFLGQFSLGDLAIIRDLLEHKLSLEQMARSGQVVNNSFLNGFFKKVLLEESNFGAIINSQS